MQLFNGGPTQEEMSGSDSCDWFEFSAMLVLVRKMMIVEHGRRMTLRCAHLSRVLSGRCERSGKERFTTAGQRFTTAGEVGVRNIPR